MATHVNLHEAKTYLSRLVEQAGKGREFVIAKADRPMVRVVPVEPAGVSRELGFLAGHGVIEADVKKAVGKDIEQMFDAPR